MAKNNGLTPRTIRTRAQSKHLQEQNNSRNKITNKAIKKRRTKRQNRQTQSQLKKRISMKNRKKNKANTETGDSAIKINNKYNANKSVHSDPLTIQVQMELEKLRKLNNDKHQTIFMDRHVSLSESSNGKSIQITCKNFTQQNIKKGEDEVPIEFNTSRNWSEASTVRVETPNIINNSLNCNNTIPFTYSKDSSATFDVNINKTSTPKPTSRISLSTQCKLYLQNIQGTNNLIDEVIEEIISDESDNDVICLDSVHESEEINTCNNDVVCIPDSNSESLMLIDDGNGNKNNVNIIDLTTPIKPTSKDKQPKRGQQILQQTPSIASHNFPSTSTQPRVCSEFPLVLNGRLMDPPAVLVPVLPQHSQLLQNNSFQYTHQSNVYGNNFLNFGSIRTAGLRPIFIDGNNIAMLHSNGKYFSVIGLKICIDYFKMRGHDVTAIVPQIRKRKKQNSDSKLLFKLEKEGSVIFTPSRVINGKIIVPYDDRFIVQLAAVHQGVIISCDNFKDILLENANLREVIENRVLNPTFVKNMIIFPSDPLGQYGPKLDDFLKFPPQ